MKKTILAILLILSLLAGFAACAKDPSDASGSDPAASVSGTEAASASTEAATIESVSAQEGSFVFTKENYPKMGGSLANLPLGQAVTATVLGITREQANDLITFAGSTTDNYKAIVDGGFDILLAYEPSEEAKEYIKNAGVELEMTPIGVDALVFICSKENPVNSISLEQVKSVYRGEVNNWKALGGSDVELIPYQRNKDSGSQTLFDKLVNLGDDLMVPPTGLQIPSMIGLLEAVADYDNSEGALGYTVYYYLTNMEKEKLDTAKILDVDGVTPSNETIGDGSYPLTNDFYVVIRSDAAQNSPERILYNWICSDQGRQLVLNENYPVRK